MGALLGTATVIPPLAAKMVLCTLFADKSANAAGVPGAGTPTAGDDVGSHALLPSISAADVGEGGVGSRGAGEDMLVELA